MGFNVDQIQHYLNTNSMDDSEKTGKSVASYLDKCENLLMEAFTAGDSYAELEPIASKLGFQTTKTENGKTVPVELKQEAIQNVAQQRYEKAMRNFSLFSQILSQTNQMLMNIINKIGK